MQALVIIEAQGKVGTWRKVLSDIGMKADVLATHGHISAFPDHLWPLGLSFSPDLACDPGRQRDPARMQRIADITAALPANAPIFIATDDDTEGDVISLDVIEGLLHEDAGLARRLFRVRPRALTRDGISAAIDKAEPLHRHALEIMCDAVPGRARAVTDRWIGAVFSRRAAHPVGRVRSALLGAFLLLEKAPDLLRDRPEIGEITLRCRASGGGQPFIAHVAIDGCNDEAPLKGLIDLAGRFSGKMLPGVIRPRQSLSAAVAPRTGSVRPFNTGDALAYAARHFSLGARQAMRGLQDAYMAGLSSYPRTESRSLSRESAVRITRLGEACRLSGLDVDALCPQMEGVSAPRPPRPGNERRIQHEALHPVCDLDRERIEVFEALLRRPIAFRDQSGQSPETIRDLMAAIVARRAFEAAREVTFEIGDWRPDNIASVTPDEAVLLSDLEWQRETTPSLPWSRDLMTGVRSWPLQAVAIDMMMIEGIGRPSTLAGHADIAVQSGEIEPGDILAPPRPSPLGRAVLAKIPRAMWNPATCRMIELALSNEKNLCQEGPKDSLQRRIHRRLQFWMRHLPDDMRNPLLEALDEGAGARGMRGVSQQIAQLPSEAQDASPTDIPDGLSGPTPFAT